MWGRLMGRSRLFLVRLLGRSSMTTCKRGAGLMAVSASSLLAGAVRGCCL